LRKTLHVQAPPKWEVARQEAFREPPEGETKERRVGATEGALSKKKAVLHPKKGISS